MSLARRLVVPGNHACALHKRGWLKPVGGGGRCWRAFCGCFWEPPAFDKSSNVGVNQLRTLVQNDACCVIALLPVCAQKAFLMTMAHRRSFDHGTHFDQPLDADRNRFQTSQCWANCSGKVHHLSGCWRTLLSSLISDRRFLLFCACQ